MRRTPSGFTLLELLVAIAVVGGIVAVLMPAVQMAREAARRGACLNNLRQLGLAMHCYESINRRLPAGYWSGKSLDGYARGYAWTTALLPYCEESTLHDRFRFDLPVHHAENRTPREQHVVLLQCPADSVVGQHYVGTGEERYAASSYVANFGPPDLDAFPDKRDGVFSRDSRTLLRDISDGLGKTLMLGERRIGPPAYAEESLVFEPQNTWSAAARDPETLQDRGFLVLFQTGHRLNSPEPDHRDVSTSHVEASPFLMCDGSAHAVNHKSDQETYRGWSTRSGGEYLAQTKARR